MVKNAMETLGRGLKGMLVGAGMASVIAMTSTFFLAGPVLLDQNASFRDLEKALLVTTLVGVFIGGIAGFAARLPSKGVSILTSIAIVGVSTGVGGLLPVLGWIPDQQPLWLYLSAILGTLLGGVIVFVYGIIDEHQWFATELRYAKSVLRWGGLLAVAATLVWACWQSANDLRRFPGATMALVVSTLLSAWAAFACKQSWSVAASPFVAATVGALCMGVVPKGSPDGAVAGFLVGLLIILFPFERRTTPNRKT
jgi:hypothetical protein